MLLGELHLLDRSQVNLCLLNLVEFFGHFVVFDALLNDTGQLFDLREVLQVVVHVERELFDLLHDQKLNLPVYLLHLIFDLSVLYGLVWLSRLRMLPLHILRH